MNGNRRRLINICESDASLSEAKFISYENIELYG